MNEIRPLLKIDHYKPFWKVIIYAKNSDKPIELTTNYFDTPTDDILKIVTNKKINEIGTFVLSFVFRRRPKAEQTETVETWYEKITPNDLVVIQLGRFKDKDILSNKQYTTVFIGLVDSVTKSLAFAGDMKPKRQITIQGKDLTKLLLSTTIYFNEFATAIQDFQQVPEGSSGDYFGVDFAGLKDILISVLVSAVVPNQVSTLKEVIDSIFDFFYKLKINIILKFKQGTEFVDIRRLLGYDVVPFKTYKGEEPQMFYFQALAPFMLNVWDLLLKYGTPQPYNEILVREHKDTVKTTVLIRGISEYIDYKTGELKGNAPNTETHKLTEDELGIVSYDLGRTDSNAWSIYTVSPMSYTGGVFHVGKMTANALTWCPPNMALYGYKVWKNSTPYTVSADQSFMKTAKDLSKSFALLNWKLPNQEFGRLTVKGNAQFQIGDIIEITYNNKKKMRYYISGVTHDFTPFYGSWITILTVERGVQIQ